MSLQPKAMPLIHCVVAAQKILGARLGGYVVCIGVCMKLMYCHEL